MSLVYNLDNGVLYFVTVGDVAYDEGLRCLQAAFAEAAAATPTRPWHLLFDIRQSTEHRRGDEVDGIASLIAAHRHVLSSRCAVVASDPFHFGVARMFAAYLDSQGFAARAFHEMEEAERWLRGE